MILSLLLLSRNVELNLLHYLNYFAALRCKIHSAHHALETVDLLRQDTRLYSAGPMASIHLNPVDYEIWAIMQCRVYQTKIRIVVISG